MDEFRYKFLDCIVAPILNWIIPPIIAFASIVGFGLLAVHLFTPYCLK